jgi:8-oxo-dGTP pyrophosphatase MutT (NUDIX family)
MMPVEERFRLLRSALAEFTPQIIADDRKRVVAAVAVVLRVGGGDIEALLIHRAERTSDPWSGHMAFPGGRLEPGDASPFHAAVRETGEEIALDVEHDATCLGRMSDATPRGRGRRLGLVIEPFVFVLHGDPALRLSDEVQSVVWVPLRFLRDRGNRRSLWYWRAVVPVRLPCYRYEGHLIWGLTLRILDEIVELSPGADRAPASR